MNNLYEYIDPIASPYEAFLSDSTHDLLPIPAHWHYYVELLYVRKGEIEVSLDNVVSTCTKGAVILFPPKCVHSIALARGSSPVQYDVIKFDPNLLPSCKTDEIDLRAMLHGIHAYRCSCIFSPEQIQDGKTSTYFLFSLGMYWEGQVVDASTLYQNDQYFFIYEDPFYYYSQYKRVTGTFYVKRNNDENVTVKLNLRLHDGVRFKAEVTADLMKPSGGGTPE